VPPHLGQDRFLRIAQHLRLGGKKIAKPRHATQLWGRSRP
jgi:hypothetical protein